MAIYQAALADRSRLPPGRSSKDSVPDGMTSISGSNGLIVTCVSITVLYHRRGIICVSIS